MINLTDFGLKSGTFRTLPSDESVKHWSGLPEEKKKLTDIIQSVRSDDIGQSEFIIMCGAYGGGKTHAMRYFAREIIEKGDGYAFFIAEILHGHKTTFLGVFHHIINKHKKMLPGLVSHVQFAVKTEVKNARGAGKDPEISDSNDFQQKVIEDAIEKDDSVDLISKFVDLPPNSNEDEIADVLIKLVTDDYSAASVLATLIGVMTSPIGTQSAKYKAVYVFFDEMEISLTLKPTDQFSFFGALRQLINATADCYCGILLAFTEHAANLEVQVERFLWERMTRPLWEFDHLDNETAKQFATEYLKASRLDEESSLQPFSPFSEEAMTYIIEQKSQIVPRSILRDMAQVFERSVRDGLVAPGEDISRDVAEKILSEINS